MIRIVTLFFLMNLRLPRSTRTDTLLPCTTLFRSRGRVYPVPPHLNHMGADLNRGILTFAYGRPLGARGFFWLQIHLARSEEHTSELQSLIRTSSAVFCLKKKNNKQ